MRDRRDRQVAHPKTESNPRGAGRRKGVRVKKSDTAVVDYIMGRGSITDIAKKNNVARGYMHDLINRTSDERGLTAKGAVELVESIDKSFQEGVNKINVLKKSDNPLFHKVADEILDDLRATNLGLAQYIQRLTSSVLGDLDIEIGTMRKNRLMDMRGIAQALTNLKLASDIVGMPKAPSTQINIQNNQATIQNQKQESKNKKLEIEFVGVDKK